MPTLDLSNFNIVCAVLGGFSAAFGLISFLAKEKSIYPKHVCREIVKPDTHLTYLLIFGSDFLWGWSAFWTSCEMDPA